MIITYSIKVRYRRAGKFKFLSINGIGTTGREVVSMVVGRLYDCLFSLFCLSTAARLGNTKMSGNRCVDDDDSDQSVKQTDLNESQKWLFSYPGKLMPSKNEMCVSLTKATFVEPVKSNTSTKGKRKKILEDFYRQVK